LKATTERGSGQEKDDDAKALRALGRNTDAEALEQRVAQIRSTSMQPN
jgi:hypothetical protein